MYYTYRNIDIIIISLIGIIPLIMSIKAQKSPFSIYFRADDEVKQENDNIKRSEIYKYIPTDYILNLIILKVFTNKKLAS